MLIIGERVNATRKVPRNAITQRDAATIADEIRKQEKAGADYIDLNAGTGQGDSNQEGEDLSWLVDVALETTEKPFCLDASDPAVIAAAAAHLGDRRPWMLNSVKCEPEVLEPGLELAAAHKAPVVALAMDETGIPRDAESRLSACRRIYEAAMRHGIAPGDLFFDPLVFPISADIAQGMVTLCTLQGIKREFPEAKTTMGASNFSYGLPKRAELNRTFLAAAITHGLDSAICDPTRPSIRRALVLGDLIAGQDRHCRRYNRAVKRGLFD
ncbi:MAG: dihydropteroate synthase [Planctomycetota bacterium]